MGFHLRHIAWHGVLERKRPGYTRLAVWWGIHFGFNDLYNRIQFNDRNSDRTEYTTSVLLPQGSKSLRQRSCFKVLILHYFDKIFISGGEEV